MIFVLLISAVGIAAACVLVFPMLRPKADATPVDWRAYDRAVYKDQLGEIYADRSQGLITEQEAEAARVEVARRLLATDDTRPDAAVDPMEKTRDPSPSPVTTLIGFLAIVFICVGAFALYVFRLGMPGMPDFPYESRLAAARAQADDGEVTEKNLKIAELRQAIEHDTFNPGLRMSLAFLLKDTAKKEEALFHAREAIRLAPENPKILSDFTVIRLTLDNGLVTQETHDAALQALTLDRTLTSPRAFLGFEREQGGDMAGAIAIWKDLRRDLSSDSDLAKLIDRKFAEAKAASGVDPATVQPRHPLDFPAQSWNELNPPPLGVTRSAGPRQTSQPPRTSGPMLNRSLSPIERAALEANVEITRGKLENAPRDFDQWMQLARTQRMLGDYQEAIRAYKTAIDIQPKDMEARRGAAFVMIALAEKEGREVAAPEAYELLRGVVRDNPSDMHALVQLGVDAAARGDVGVARDLWSRALVLGKNDTTFAANLRARIDALADE